MHNDYFASKLKRAILLAYERGDLWPGQAESLIRAWGLESA